jgi:hypothetical protein
MEVYNWMIFFFFFFQVFEEEPALMAKAGPKAIFDDDSVNCSLLMPNASKGCHTFSEKGYLLRSTSICYKLMHMLF